MSKKRVVIFSGGTAANSLIDVFTTLCSEGLGLDFVLPVSDNGGSSSAILQVFGGPGIGDIRSRLIRLVPEKEQEHELLAIKKLLSHRMPTESNSAYQEWQSLVEGTHPLWTGISSEKRELLRSFFNQAHLEILKKRRPNSFFDFSSASTGNLFLTGARVFFGSLESAIYLFRSITGIPENVQVLPAINSNFTHHIAAGLKDGSAIIGQNQISHPSAAPDIIESEISAEDAEGYDDTEHDDAHFPGHLAQLRTNNITFSKDEDAELASSIERIWYINVAGQEIRPPANPRVISAIKNAEAVIYSIGSLYTSLIPCLVLRNVGRALAATPPNVPKVLLLNGSLDRETSSMNGLDFVRAVGRACQSSIPTDAEELTSDQLKTFVTHVIYLEGNGAPSAARDELKEAGIECIRVYGRKDVEGKGMLYDQGSLLQALGAIFGRNARKNEGRRMTIDGTMRLS